MIQDAIKLSIEGLVQPFEGCHKRLPDGRFKAYPDPGTGGAPWTIGWGSTGPDIGPDTIWTQEQCDARLEADLADFTMRVLRLSPKLALDVDRRLAAIISFAYNCGVGNYRISTLKRRVDEQDWEGAAEQIVRWNKANGRVLRGLTRRREAEAAFLR